MFRSWQTEYDTRRWSRIDKVVLHPKFIEFNKVGNADFEKSKGNFGKTYRKWGKYIYVTFGVKGFEMLNLCVSSSCGQERSSCSMS